MLPVHAARSPWLPTRLSVSSDGSCGMLPGEGLRRLERLPLSVSSDGSCGMLPFSASASRWRISAFSILRRIVWNATLLGKERLAFRLLFQYPQTDRVECYNGHSADRVPRKLLSVSSDGSCGMLPSSGRMSFSPDPALSVSSDGSCGMLPHHAVGVGGKRHLSVSSDGSCGMLRRSSGRRGLRGMPFQYPQTDRVECYRWYHTPRRLPWLPFSILRRIVWNATRGGVSRPGG